MNKMYLALVLLLMPSLAGAKWVLHQSDDGHWISGHNPQQHELVLSQSGQNKKILLVFSHKENLLHHIPETALFSTDNNKAIQFPLKLIKQHADGLAMQIVLDKTETRTFINLLVGGATLHVKLEGNINTDFSLIGFTTTFNDFLIANDIGRLDPMWLQYENRVKELLCYEISQAMVSAMGMRRKGKSSSEVYAALSGKLSDDTETALPDVIEQVYSVPIRSLPKIPSTRKYEFFVRCMKSRH